MRIVETGGAHHRLRLQGKKRIPKTALYVCDQVTLENNRFGELSVPYFQTYLVNRRGRYQDLVVQQCNLGENPFRFPYLCIQTDEKFTANRSSFACGELSP
jgi:hypothetical protein